MQQCFVNDCQLFFAVAAGIRVPYKMMQQLCHERHKIFDNHPSHCHTFLTPVFLKGSLSLRLIGNRFINVTTLLKWIDLKMVLNGCVGMLVTPDG